MTRLLFVAIGLLALGAIVSGPAAAQQKVYQWKDASGRMHYSSTPPASGKYTERGVVAGPATPAASAQPENSQCTRARSNMAILKGSTNVRIDSDGDGKPDRLMSTDEHAAQVKLAESIISTSCSAPPKA